MLCGGILDPHFPKRGDCAKKVKNFSAYQGKFLMMILLIPSLKTSTGDQQIIDVVIRENASFSERAAVALLV